MRFAPLFGPFLWHMCHVVATQQLTLLSRPLPPFSASSIFNTRSIIFDALTARQPRTWTHTS